MLFDRFIKREPAQTVENATSPEVRTAAQKRAAEIKEENKPKYTESWREATHIVKSILATSDVTLVMRGEFKLLRSVIAAYPKELKEKPQRKKELSGPVEVPSNFQYAPLPFTKEDLQAALVSEPPHILAPGVVTLYNSIIEITTSNHLDLSTFLSLCTQMRKLYETVWIMVTPDKDALNKLQEKGYTYQPVEQMFQTLSQDIKKHENMIKAFLENTPPEITVEVYQELILYLQNLVKELDEEGSIIASEITAPEYTQYKKGIPIMSESEIRMSPLMTRLLLHEKMKKVITAISDTVDDFLVVRGVEAIYTEVIEPITLNLVIDSLLPNQKNTQRVTQAIIRKFIDMRARLTMNAAFR